ncbi:MAG: site-specific integrase, partial [Flavobacterium sp.]
MSNLKAFQEYLQLEKNYSLHTVNAYGNDLLFFQEFLKNNFGQESLEEVNYSMIRSWIVFMVDEGISNSSINRKISSLKSFYKFLLKIKQIESSPLLKHKSLKTPKKIQIPFSEKELDSVLNHIQYPEGFDGIRDKLIIDIFYTTGIRRTELINLNKQNIDLA